MRKGKNLRERGRRKEGIEGKMREREKSRDKPRILEFWKTPMNLPRVVTPTENIGSKHNSD